MVQGPQQPEEQEETLGQIIRASRKAHSLSQEDLADEIGTTKVTVSRWERDLSFPRGDDIHQALIEVLDLPKKTFIIWKEKELAKQDEEVLPVEEVKRREETFPLEKIVEDEQISSPHDALVHQYWHPGSLPSFEDLQGQEIVEYKIPAVIAYRGVDRPLVKEREITTNGKVLLPDDKWARTRYPSYSHMFSWGRYAGGSGSSNLARAILLDYFENMYPDTPEEELRSWVWKYYWDFKWEFVFKFDDTSWEIWSGAITAWLKEQKEVDFERNEYDHKIYPENWVPWSRRWDRYKGT